MSKIKTAISGKTVDMAALVKQHEETIAVGNVRMNAKGDVIDRKNKPIVTAKEQSQAQHKTPSRTTETAISKTKNLSSATEKKAEGKNNTITEVSRKPIKNDDGVATHIEIEYSDGNIEVIDVAGQDPDFSSEIDESNNTTSSASTSKTTNRKKST